MDFRIDPAQIRAVETNVTYTVLVVAPEPSSIAARDTDDWDEAMGGLIVRDFETIMAQYAAVRTDTWTQVPLMAQNGGTYTGSHRFPAAGNYTVALVGRRRGQPSAAALYSVSVTVLAPSSP